MRTPSKRIRKLSGLAMAPLAMLAAAGLVWNASFAAFSGETRNSGNDWSTGSVALSDDDNGSARFNVANMVPGQTDNKCITVTATASVPGTVKLYLLNPVTSVAGLEDHIMLTVTSGSGGSFASCTGYTSDSTVMTTQSLTSATAAYHNYATGTGSWVTAGNPSGEAMTYQFTWTFDTTGLTQDQLDALQGHHAGVDFEWEIQNN